MPKEQPPLKSPKMPIDPSSWEVVKHSPLGVRTYLGGIKRDDKWLFHEIESGSERSSEGISATLLNMFFEAAQSDPQSSLKYLDIWLGIQSQLAEQCKEEHSEERTFIVPGVGEIINLNKPPFDFGCIHDTLKIYFAAIIRGHEPITTALASVPETQFGIHLPKTFGLTHFRDFILLCLFKALQFWKAKERDKAIEQLEMAEETYIETLDKYSRPNDWLIHREMPLVTCFKTILTSPGDFDNAFVNALKQHREYFCRKRGMNRGDQPMCDMNIGLTALHLAGIYAIAKKEGITSWVVSGYVPHWLFHAS